LPVPPKTDFSDTLLRWLPLPKPSLPIAPRFGLLLRLIEQLNHES
jgi:hypothetical protein